VLKIIWESLVAGRATQVMPEPDAGFPGKGIGRYQLARADPEAVKAAIEICPAEALAIERSDNRAELVIDDGRCVQCGLCAEGDPPALVNVGVEPAMGRTRESLRRRFSLEGYPGPPLGPDFAKDDQERVRQEGEQLSQAIRQRLRRSLQVRHLDAGGCNGCEWELNQLQSPTYDVQRFGVDFVASPRHADVLLVTGVMTRNLELALVRTLDAMPRPRRVVAVGVCAVSGGIFGTSYASRGGADRVVAVDGYLGGCPPRPWAMIRALRMVLE
jgi:Ni,Fe-hydrogenase III small subunit/NAD-dependent dihydropyrimidine dehydrogenase PreA subunit